MKDKGLLAIIIKSDRHFGYAESLASAAISKGKKVLIHMLGPGAGFIDSTSRERLCGVTEMTVSSCSLAERTRRSPESVPASVRIVSPEHLESILDHCERHVVF